MIYTFDILFTVFVATTGFATSWIVLDIARELGWDKVPAPDGSPGALRKAVVFVLAAFVGPRLLLANGFDSWRKGRVSLPLYAVIALVSIGWSMCSGVVVLQAAFASGYFLA